MHLRKLKYFIIVLATLISCEKEVKTGIIPEFEQKLVVSSFISPADTVSTVIVGSNKRIYGDLGILESLGDLTAFISDGAKEIHLLRTTTGFKFSANDFKIDEGKSYKLRVLSNKGLETEAECTVPITRNLQPVIDTFTVIKTGWYPSFTTKISITDFPGEDNYYRLYCVQENFYMYNNKKMQYKTMFSGFNNEFFTDKGRDGENIEIASIVLNNTRTLDSSFFKVYILNTNKEYYDYHESIKKYSGGDDPFTEVSPVFTNITGGLGIFAAYTIDSLIFRLK
jgi:hypothetical protein